MTQPQYGLQENGEKPKKLKVLIAGGGIGGLVVACALRDHDVTVFERKSPLVELGAGIHLKPNASRIAFKLGMDLTRLNPVTVHRVLELRGTSNDKVAEMKVAAEKMWGSPWLLTHRADLHAELYRVAKETGSRTLEIVTDANVVSCDPEAGILTLQDGTQHQGDLIIGAEGIRSTIRSKILENETDQVKQSACPRKTGLVAVRCLIAREKILADPDLKFTLEQPESTGLVMWTEKDRRIVTYPCRNLDWLNVVAFYPDRYDDSFWEKGWSKAWTPQQLQKEYQHFHSVPQRLLSYVDSCSLWQLRDLDPIPKWNRGKAVIIGDAAHAMLPHQGQGASQSFEDAEALSVLFPANSKEEINVAKQLDTFCKLRLERSHLVQQFSRQMAQGVDYDKGEKLDSFQFFKYLFGYKGAKAALDELESHNNPVTV